jgi:hypothetical protein
MLRYSTIFVIPNKDHERRDAVYRWLLWPHPLEHLSLLAASGGEMRDRLTLVTNV